MTDADIHDMRVYLAREALNAYCNARGVLFTPDEDITDLMVDLLHLLATYEGQASARLVLDMVKSHYEEESEDA